MSWVPPLTAYYIMRVGHLPLLPYFKPGDTALAGAVREAAKKHHAVLLANHGPVIAGTSLSAAVDAAEELEETAKLFLLMGGTPIRALDAEKIAELASLYIAHKYALDKLFDGRRVTEVAAMRRYVLEVSDEEQCRYFQTRIHNLQSKYDTFVKATEAERQDADLKRFRGYVAIALHLLECMTQLVHFYQRHENDIRGEQVKNRIASLIDKDAVLDRALNFCLYYTHAYLAEGLPLAQSLVKRYTSQERIILELPDGVHIHIRPASLIAEVVKHHGTPVTVTIGSDTRYAGSVLDVLMAAGANSGDRKIAFEGDTAPLRDLSLLFEQRLGEDGLSRFPRQLSYLKRPKRGP